MAVAKIIGLVVILLSITFGIFYVLWFFGFLPIDPELAVRIPVLVIVLGACFVAAWIGYIMVASPGPTSSKPNNELSRISLASYR
jgi:ABC-type thiamin/hydroxymethylpyrimidine transport system permease subunit